MFVHKGMVMIMDNTRVSSVIYWYISVNQSIFRWGLCVGLKLPL